MSETQNQQVQMVLIQAYGVKRSIVLDADKNRMTNARAIKKFQAALKETEMKLARLLTKEQNAIRNRKTVH